MYFHCNFPAHICSVLTFIMISKVVCCVKVNSVQIFGEMLASHVKSCYSNLLYCQLLLNTLTSLQQYFSLQKNCPTSFMIFLNFFGYKVYQKILVPKNVLLNDLAKKCIFVGKKPSMLKFDPVFDQSFQIAQIILRF